MRINAPTNTVAILCALAILPVALYVAGAETTRFLWRESGPIETVSAVAYVVAAVFAAQAARTEHGFARLIFILWSCLCILCAGEETSWLQHVIGYDTPESVAAINAQGEFNLHNLEFLHGGALLTEGISLGSLLTSQNLFQAGFTAFFLGAPVAAVIPGVASILKRLRVPYPGPTLTIGIWVPIAACVATTFAGAIDSDTAAKSAAGETREMFYALAIMIFLVCARRSSAVAGQRMPIAGQSQHI